MPKSDTPQMECLTKHSAIQYAAEELKRCLSRMMPGGTFSIQLGLFSDFSGIAAPSVEDPTLDDAVLVDMKSGNGIIAGANPRSVLLAAYRYLTELGCRWVRPGADGEFIPRLESIPDVKLAEKPSYRHRGMCIEGAVSCEHVCDLIEWMPKVGYNGYFIQFRESYIFFERWYSHRDNPLVSAEKLPVEKSREYMAQVVAEIEKRDLLYHGVGHGWTCEPFGIPGLGWDAQEDNVPDSVRKYFAEIKGERKLWGGVALNTNLCYSNPEVRRIMVEDIVSYSEHHPEVDLLHIWLADGSNNNCECAECRKARPSDFYVMLLNEIDAALSAKGLPTRIAFLIYVDLLWPPVAAKLTNPGRFVLMFAPIVRTYSEAFSPSAELPAIPEYQRNQLKFPAGVDANVSFLKGWQEIFQGDSFDFDYHLMWDHFRDPGHMAITEIISKDMKGLRGIGLNGYVSCQPQRLFFPTGIPMTVMGQTLWNSETDLDAAIQDYLRSAYGADWKACGDYLKKLSELFDPRYLRLEKPTVNEENAAKLAQIPGVIEAFKPIIERNLNLAEPCHAKSWAYLKEHAELYGELAKALELRARGEREKAHEMWAQIQRDAWAREGSLHPVFDVWEFCHSTFNWMFASDK